MDPFEQIANEAMVKAECVDCSGPAFLEGLELMIQMLEDRLACSRAEYEEKDNDNTQ